MEKVLYISGMHCPSCDLLVRETIHNIGGIEIITLTEQWELTYNSSNKNDYILLKTAIESCGYQVALSQDDTLKNKPMRKEGVILTVFGLLVWWILTTVDVTWYVADLWTNGAMGYGEMFFLWFIASLSTCLALVGWFVLMRWSLQWWTKESFRDALRHQWLFQLWRIWWYALWWALLWRIWSALIFSPTVNGTINGVVSILLLIMWRNMLWWKLISLPVLWWWEKLMDLLRHFSTKKRWGIIVGALTFFLPCGFTQVAQFNALNTWSVLQWALLLGTFALWTLPVLLTLWVTGNRFQSNQNWRWYKLLWVFIVVLSLFLLQSALNLLWL